MGRWIRKLSFIISINLIITPYITWTIGNMYYDYLKKQLNLPKPISTEIFFTFVSNVIKKETVEKSNSTDHLNKIKEPSQGSIPVWTENSNEQNKNEQIILLAPEDLLKIKEKITSEDKIKIYTLLSSKLTQDEIEKISFLMENDITLQKLNQIQEIIKKQLSEQEYSELTFIFSKYTNPAQSESIRHISYPKVKQ